MLHVWRCLEPRRRELGKNIWGGRKFRKYTSHQEPCKTSSKPPRYHYYSRKQYRRPRSPIRGQVIPPRRTCDLSSSVFGRKSACYLPAQRAIDSLLTRRVPNSATCTRNPSVRSRSTLHCPCLSSRLRPIAPAGELIHKCSTKDARKSKTKQSIDHD